MDDGSADNTKEIVSNWIKENKIIIKYFYQENQGRSFALKKAILLSDMEYIVIMDDDCYFVNDFVKKLQKFNNLKIDYNSNVAGVAYLREDEFGKIKGNEFPNNYIITDLVTMKRKHKKRGEISEITKTSILKDHIYPSYNNEKRISTDCLWLSISENYEYIFVNEVIRVSQYSKDGITKNLRLHKILSPQSSFYYEVCVINHSKINFIYKMFSIIKCQRWFFSIKNFDKKKLFKLFPKKYYFYFFTLLIFGFILYLSDLVFKIFNNQKIR